MLGIITIAVTLTNVMNPAAEQAQNISGQQSIRTTSSASTNIVIVKDRIYQSLSGSSTVTDYNLTWSLGDARLMSGNPIVNGTAFYSNSFVDFAVVGTTRGSFMTLLPFSAQMGAVSSNFVGFDSLTLGSNINFSVSSLLPGKNSSNWGYNPVNTDLSTNQTVWPKPQDLSCVGTFHGNGSQVALISTNLAVSVGHFHPSVATFRDTNGIAYTAVVVTNWSNGSDFWLLGLQSNMPPSVVPAWILPPAWTNNISFFTGIFAFWPHANTHNVDLIYSYGYPVSIFGETIGVGGLVFSQASTNQFGMDPGATPGDSSSPILTCVTNATVFLGALTQSIGVEFVSSPQNFDCIRTNYGLNGIKLITLTGYPTF